MIEVNGTQFEMDEDFIEYYVEYNLDGGPILLDNHRWLLEEIKDVLTRIDGHMLTDGRRVQCSHLIKQLEDTLNDKKIVNEYNKEMKEVLR